LISNCIKVCYKEVDIEASSLRLQHRYDTMRCDAMMMMMMIMIQPCHIY